MSFFSRLFAIFRRKGNGQGSSDEFRSLAQKHSKAWSVVTFEQDATKSSAQAYEAILRFINDNSVDIKTRTAVLKKVLAILDSFRITYEYTNEAISTDMSELLRYSIIGWTSEASHPLLDGVTGIIQMLLQNTSIRMTSEERKSIMAALLECRLACASRLAQDGFEADQAGIVEGLINGIRIDIQGNVTGSRILDSIQALKEELNRIPVPVVYPEFRNYPEFAGTVDAAIEAIRNKLRLTENELQSINANMESIRATYKTLAENDPRRDALSREYDVLKTREKAARSIAETMTNREGKLITLKEAISLIKERVDLAAQSEFIKIFRNTNYLEILSSDKYEKIMAVLEAYKAQYSESRPNKRDIFDEPKVNAKKTSALDDDVQAETAKMNAKTSALDEDVKSSHTLN